MIVRILGEGQFEVGEDKIEALVRLQQRALEIAVATGRKPNRVWKLRSKS